MLMDDLKGKRVDSEAKISGFLRHVRTCNNALLPGERLVFGLGDLQVGWVKPRLAEALAAFPEAVADGAGVSLRDAAALARIARALSQQGHFRWRNEAFDVRAVPDGPVLAQIDRGALPSFGVFAVGAHLNGLVHRPDGLHLWIARRAENKALDPGKLDHITAGGVPAGLTPWQTLIKEAEEEAAIQPSLTSQARPVATIAYKMERAEGLRRDIIHCYDLDLPDSFEPRAADGEVAAFELRPLAEVVATVRDTDAFKFNVNLVLIDLFLRQGLIAGPEATELRVALDAGKV
jgi:8-oxo-dGTP pyrophosphatase MutT (NUDIX family)